MYLSMYLLEKWFKDKGYQVQSAINEGSMCLVGARISDNVTLRSIACISVKSADLVAIINRNDVIFVPNATGNEVLNKTIEAFEYYNAWEVAMLRGAFSGAPLSALLDLANLAIKRPMLIKNSRSEVCAITESYGPQVHPLWGKYLKYVDLFPARVHDYGRAFNELIDISRQREPQVAYSPMYQGHFMYANIIHNDHRVGYISAYEHGKPFEKSDLQLMQVFQQIINFCVSANMDMLFSHSVIEDYMAATLSGEDYIKHSPSDIYSLNGWDESDPLTMFVLSPVAVPARNAVANIQEKLENSIYPINMISIHNCMVYLVNLKRYGSYKRLIQVLRDNVDEKNFIWGSCHVFTGLTELKHHYDICMLSVAYAKEKGLSGASILEAHAHILTTNLSKVPNGELMCHPAYQMLADYDKKNDTQLALTFFWYLFYNRNLMNVASVMGVHRNTINNRIIKVFELLKDDNFDDFSIRLSFLLTYLTKHPEIT